MQIYARVKKSFSRRSKLEKVPYETTESIYTLKTLIEFFVEKEVERYNKKTSNAENIELLTNMQIEEKARTGKVDFGGILNPQKVDSNKAKENAIQCFKDGMVKVFRGDTELTELDEKIELSEGDEFTFIRLIFLSGSMLY